MFKIIKLIFMFKEKFLNKNKKLDFKKIFFVLLILATLLIFIFFVLFNYLNSRNNNAQNNLQNQQNKFVKLSLSNFSANSGFTLVNNLTLQNLNTNYYTILDFEEVVVNFRNVAQKFNLNKELSNKKSGTYRWVQNDFRDEEYIYVDSQKGYFEINFSDKNYIEFDFKSTDSVDKLKNILNLNYLDIKFKESIKVDNKLQLAKYKLYFQNKAVYFDVGIDAFITLYIVNNKITYIFGYLFSSYLSQPLSLKPLSYIGPENISQLYYRFDVFSDTNNPNVTSELGAEYVPAFPLKIGFKQVKEDGYIVFKDNSVDKWLLLPIIVIESSYFDAGDKRGTLDFVVVNQDPF